MYQSAQNLQAMRKLALVSGGISTAEYYRGTDLYQKELEVLQLMSRGTRSQVTWMEMEKQLSTLTTMVYAVQEQQSGQQ